MSELRLIGHGCEMGEWYPIYVDVDGARDGDEELWTWDPDLDDGTLCRCYHEGYGYGSN